MASSSSTKVQNASQMAKVTQNLRHHFECQTFCDITFTTSGARTEGPEQEAIKCHKVVLSSSCRYFKEKFLKDPNIDSIDLSPMKMNVLKELLDFIYSGKCSLSDDNVFELLATGLEWKNIFLPRECFTFLKYNININNVCKYYESALLIDNAQLVNKFSLYIQKYFIEIFYENKFHGLSLDGYYRIIKQSELNVCNENIVFKGLIQFKEKNPNVELNFDHIRFHNLTKDYLFNEVIFHPLVSGSRYMDRIKSACEYKVENVSVTSEATRSWKIENTSHIVCFNKSNRVLLFDQRDKIWQDLRGLPNWVDELTTMVIQDDRCFVIGASSDDVFCSNVCEISLTQPYTLTYLENYPLSLCGCSAVVHGHYLYSFGGRNASFVSDSYRYSFFDKTWEPIAPFPNNDAFILSVSKGNYIYLFGGMRNDRCLYSYNVYTSIYKRLADIPVGCSGFTDSVYAFRETIVVVMNKGVMTYHLYDDQWTINSKYNNNLTDVRNVCIYQESNCCLLVDGEGTFKKYDFDSKTWCATDIPAVETGDFDWSYTF